MTEGPLPPRGQQARRACAAWRQSPWDGLSALRRRPPAQPVRASSSACATQADDACRGGWRSRGGKRWSRGGAGGRRGCSSASSGWRMRVGRGLLLQARAGAGADGVPFDGPGVQPPGGWHLGERPRLRAALGYAGLGRSVVVRAASPEGARGRVPGQASGGWQQHKLFSGGVDTVWHCSRRQQPSLVPRYGCWRGSPPALIIIHQSQKGL